MKNNEDILYDLDGLDQKVKAVDDNLVDALKQNEDRLYDLVKISLPVPVFTGSLIFNKNIHDMIQSSILLISLYDLILVCYFGAIFLYGFSYFLGAWDSTIKRQQLYKYYNEIGMDDIGKSAIKKLNEFLNIYYESGSSKLKIALALKEYSIYLVFFTLIFFIVLIFLLFSVNIQDIYIVSFVLLAISLIYFFIRRYHNGK
jgi:hypothetical protein